ncbi:branched-chain amino acid ABC transporter permease [Oceanicola sp. S124]|uniref:branched-chain amino acid ABC transporter permease n=1 Tax=Oceanicola sp. S124 TaxID=1042378 RepID=UPI00025582A5|nr:branched-chain amino acid ABC transporter permease [Oceanicola sp. S124]
MSRKDLTLHLGLVALLFALHFILPAYHHGIFARVMVLAVYAVGYNIAFGYTGLLSLGHAMFFAAGMYGMGLVSYHFGVPALPAWFVGVACAAALAFVVGLLALRTQDVSFMIVTLMFAQAAYLIILYFSEVTRGDDGFVIPGALRAIGPFDLSDEGTRYIVAWILFSTALLFSLWLVRHPFGRVLVALRENEERARLLGYDTGRRKLASLVISGTISGAAGAAYAGLFGYVGGSFAGVQYSIFALLWVLLGGAGTVLGPFIGTLFMFYLIDLATEVTEAYMLIAGVVLVLLTLFAPQGIVGEIRRRLWKDLP